MILTVSPKTRTKQLKSLIGKLQLTMKLKLVRVFSITILGRLTNIQLALGNAELVEIGLRSKITTLPEPDVRFIAIQGLK